MELKKNLLVSCIGQEDELPDKESVLKAISSLAGNNPVLKDVSTEEIYKAFKEREDLSSTGLGKGIAIPHCTLNISEFVLGALTIAKGVDFSAIDGQPVYIVLFMIAPRDQRTLHIRYLSALSIMLNNELNRKKIMGAVSPEALLGIMIRHTDLEEKAVESNSGSLFHIIVQEEEILDEVLEMITSIDDTSITILDAVSAGEYLYSKPLFRNLWVDSHEDYCKLILATVPAVRTNEVIRHCDLLVKNKYRQGLLVTVQEVNFLTGSLNI